LRIACSSARLSAFCARLIPRPATKNATASPIPILIFTCVSHPVGLDSRGSFEPDAPPARCGAGRQVYPMPPENSHKKSGEGVGYSADSSDGRCYIAITLIDWATPVPGVNECNRSPDHNSYESPKCKSEPDEPAMTTAASHTPPWLLSG